MFVEQEQYKLLQNRNRSEAHRTGVVVSYCGTEVAVIQIIEKE
jgi:hypothetical protein